MRGPSSVLKHTRDGTGRQPYGFGSAVKDQNVKRLGRVWPTRSRSPLAPISPANGAALILASRRMVGNPNGVKGFHGPDNERPAQRLYAHLACENSARGRHV